MNDEEIERELQRLIPATPGEAFIGRLRKARPASRKIVTFPRWLPFAAAACVVVLWQMRSHLAPPPQPASNGGRVETFRPLESNRYLLSAKDLGIIELEPGRPYRLVRCVWADREMFRNERGASYLEVRQAREQIVPIALETL